MRQPGNSTVIFTVLFGAIFGVLSASLSKALRYQAPDECKWVVVDSGIEDDVALVCRLRTINSELENTNFSVIQPQHTVRLRLECSDALFFQSSLSAGSFRPLVELRELSIEYCKIGNLSDGAFKGLRELRNLTVRTHNTDWSAMTLEISPNAFTDELGLLERLDLGENNMWSLPEGVLCPLRSLEVLNLTRNRIREISSFKFALNPSERCGANLRLLDLSRNNIDSLPSAMLSGLTRLQKLYLQGNGLSNLADRALEGLTSLNILKLSDNRLVSLPPELFTDTRDIKEMYLQNNSINVLAPGLFGELTQLLVLDLSKNELTAEWINSATFSGLLRLVVLDLSYNRISKLEAAVFRDLYSLQILRLNDNFIETIPENTFASLYNLHTLILSNNRLTIIESSTFNGLYVLTLLSIDNNHIKTIQMDALKNCTSLQDLHLNGNELLEVPQVLSEVPMLKTLDLGENHITSIANATFQNMQHLFGLRLTENNIGNISKGVFDKMAALKILNLSRNKIQKVEAGAFDANINLQAIRLDGNYLTDIGNLFSKLPSLVWLNISDNQLEWFDYALIPTGLQWLDIHANKIAELGNYFEIESTLQLSTFDASSNKLTEITGSAIPNSVEMLFLNDNLITKVQSYTFFKKPNLTRVDLFGNKITSLDPNSLRISAVPLDKPLPEFHIGDNPYQCDCTMEWLQKVNSGNRARTQPKLMDLDSIYCKLLYNRGRTYVPLIEAAPYQFLCKYDTHCFSLCHCCDFDACDCEMTCPQNCTCYHDQSWSANVVDCSLSGYVERLPEQIPMDATQLYLDGNDIRAVMSHAFIGRKRLKVLFLNASNIEIIHNRTFNGLKELELLHLDENRIRELKGYEFEGLEGLRELYLQHNRITSIHNQTFQHLRHLRTLKLDHNRLSTYSVWHLSLVITELTLASNPWSCDCEFTERYREWLMLHGNSVQDIEFIRCVYNANTTELDYYSEEIYADNPELGFYVTHDNITSCTGAANIDNSINGNLTSTKTIIQRQAIQGYLPLLIITLGAFLVIILFTLIIFVFRQEMRVWFHSRFGVRLFYRSTEFDRDKLFDAFISYSSKDEAFVAEELAPVLENGDPQYKLCLHYRDFPVGAFIADTIVQAVESSRRTIMVLSENFIKSEWCRFEFKSAHHQVLRDRRRRLIVILLGEVPQKDLDPDIRLYLKTNTYLQWGDKLFWEKLRFALPDVPNNRRGNVNNSGGVSGGIVSGGAPGQRGNNTSSFRNNPNSNLHNHSIVLSHPHHLHRHNNRTHNHTANNTNNSATNVNNTTQQNQQRTVAMHI
ncbi:toll-like receptor Tollo [Chrysoperla carnea]|uniref:toll-like receptor Tollo n=1 Tax=Chrysoperla carnea TaxID=189513 RepID=UPI001D096C66|nr:toll-like receptor Tollo [Chrysoperla carnea]